MTDFKVINAFLSDYLYSSGSLDFPSDNDRTRYPRGIHCYVFCPVCGAKTSTEIIKGTRRSSLKLKPSRLLHAFFWY